MKTKHLLLFALVSLICFRAAAEDPAPAIDVRAAGEVLVPADMVILQLKVSTDRDDAEQAKNDNDQITARIYELAEQQKLLQPRLLSTDLSVESKQRSSGNGNNARKQDDHFDDGDAGELFIRMARDIEVRFGTLTQAVKFITEVYTWDSVQKTHDVRLMPLRFDVADRKSAYMEARRRAVENAQEKAALLAERTGLKLGNATQIDDGQLNVVGSSRIHELLDPFGSDPFSSAGAPAVQEHSHTDFRPVELRKRDSEKLEMDRLSPAQLTISVEVRVVFAATNPSR